MPSTPQPPDPAPARPTASAAPPSPPRWSSPRGLVALCTLIVVATAAVRTWVAAAGWFYWDDLLLHTRAAHHDLPGPGLLIADHDGHLMPGGMALAWINSHLAPLDFRLPLLEIALLQLLAGAALARLLWVLLRGRPVLLAPLLLASVVPLGFRRPRGGRRRSTRCRCRRRWPGPPRRRCGSPRRGVAATRSGRSRRPWSGWSSWRNRYSSPSSRRPFCGGGGGSPRST